MLLIFKSGSREGRAVDINRGRVTIGRVAENDVQLTGEKVSRHHAVIEVEEGGFAPVDVVEDEDKRAATSE